jgi:16S rRNA G966 N2-methylase RsmD
MVYFVESSRRAIDLIRSNLNELGIQSGARVVPQQAARAIGELERQQLRADFVFLDPPYKSREDYRQTLSHLGELPMVQQALVIAEHEKKFDPGNFFGSLRRIRTLEQGDAALSFYRTQQPMRKPIAENNR